MVPLALTSIINSQWASSMSSAGAVRSTPAIWARASTPPRISTARPTVLNTASRLATSQARKLARPGPVPLALATTRCPWSVRTSRATAWAPAATAARTVASPIPRALPVTMMRRLCSCMGILPHCCPTTIWRHDSGTACCEVAPPSKAVPGVRGSVDIRGDTGNLAVAVDGAPFADTPETLAAGHRLRHVRHRAPRAHRGAVLRCGDDCENRGGKVEGGGHGAAGEDAIHQTLHGTGHGVYRVRHRRHRGDRQGLMAGKAVRHRQLNPLLVHIATALGSPQD